jgi:hypothetical protein
VVTESQYTAHTNGARSHSEKLPISGWLPKKTRQSPRASASTGLCASIS